ncbi:hypothetical protein J6590_039713 [Homalodisca vitripennis]|nr:hypothetical protein J6590_039713 [Homalodisca vitripennis]
MSENCTPDEKMRLPLHLEFLMSKPCKDASKGDSFTRRHRGAGALLTAKGVRSAYFLSINDETMMSHHHMVVLRVKERNVDDFTVLCKAAYIESHPEIMVDDALLQGVG